MSENKKIRGAKRIVRGWRAMGWKPWRPLVGVWRPGASPNEVAKALAMMGPSQKLGVIYLPKGVKVRKGRVTGFMLKPGTDTWQRVITRVPDIIDTSNLCWKHNKPALEYFEEHCWCSNLRKNRINKRRLQDLMRKDAAVSRYAIPSETIKTARQFERFVHKHRDVVAKPIFSQRGLGVHRVRLISEKNGETAYLVGFKTSERRLTSEEFERYTQKHFIKPAHVAQKYVSSRSAAGDPFDCRVHVEKNGRGEWEIASMLVRIGIGQTIISNINQGGGMAEIEPFLKANRPDNWQQILRDLKSMAKTVPSWFESKRGVEMMTLGIDTAITDEGDLHIFEINSLPFTDFNLGQVAIRRVAYYRWLADNRVRTHRK